MLSIYCLFTAIITQLSISWKLLTYQQNNTLNYTIEVSKISCFPKLSHCLTENVLWILIHFLWLTRCKRGYWNHMEYFIPRKLFLHNERCLLQNSKGKSTKPVETVVIRYMREKQALHQSTLSPPKKEITHLIFLDLSPRWQEIKFI